MEAVGVLIAIRHPCAEGEVLMMILFFVIISLYLFFLIVIVIQPSGHSSL